MTLAPVLLAMSPLAYWPADDGSGTVLADASGNGRDITGYGGTFGTARLLAGTAEGSFSSTAADGSVASASWNQLTGAFSISFITDWSATSKDAALIKGGVGVGDGYGLKRRDSGVTDYLRLSTYSGGVESYLEVNVNAELRDDPHVTLVVGTYDGTDARIYVDGVLVAGPTAKTAPGSGSTALATDCSQSTSDVALWDRALTDTEVLALWTAANTPPAAAARYLGMEVLPGSATLANVAIITRDGLDDVRASDNESVALYGHRSVTVDVGLSSDADAEALAEFHANRRSRPAPVLARVDAQVAGAGADALDALAALDLGSVVTLHRTTVDGRPLDFSGVVEGMSWDLQPGGRQRLALSTSLSDTYGLYGSASWFVIGESLLGGTAVLAPY